MRCSNPAKRGVQGRSPWPPVAPPAASRAPFHTVKKATTLVQIDAARSALSAAEVSTQGDASSSSYGHFKLAPFSIERYKRRSGATDFEKMDTLLDQNAGSQNDHNSVAIFSPPVSGGPGPLSPLQTKNGRNTIFRLPRNPCRALPRNLAGLVWTFHPTFSGKGFTGKCQPRKP